MVGYWQTIYKANSDRFFGKKTQKENGAERRETTEDLKFERKKEQPHRERITELITRLKEIDIKKKKKLFISAHHDVIEPGERPSKYFFNQLKRKQAKHGMSTLKNGAGVLITEQGGILRESVSLNLYTAGEKLDKKGQLNFISNIHRVLPGKDKHDSESDLTEKELQESLGQAENEKNTRLRWDTIRILQEVLAKVILVFVGLGDFRIPLGILNWPFSEKKYPNPKSVSRLYLPSKVFVGSSLSALFTHEYISYNVLVNFILCFFWLP